jgi:hypothetical protein
MEDFIFDDDVDEVGAEVEAHCPKCKADTTHVVISKYEDEIRRVQCNPCGDVHSYRKPRGESEEDTAEPPPTKKKAQKAKPTWDQVMAKSKKQPRAYAIGEYFKEMEILTHPKFGVGYVTENIGDDKIEVTFQSEKRVLIHNRKNLTLPFLRPVNPPAATKAKGGKAAKAAAVAAPAPVVAAPAAKPAPAPAAPAAKAAPSGAARPAAKKPAAPPPAAKTAAKTAKGKAAPPPPKKVIKSPARAAAKKPAPKAKPAKKIKKSR